MAFETNKALIEHLTEAMNTGATAFIKEVIAPTFRGHVATDILTGVEGYLRYIEAVRTAFPDLHQTVEEVIGEADSVAARFSITGTNTGPLLTLPESTGKATTFESMGFYHLIDGKIVEWWQVSDRYGMLQQLGLVPTTPVREPAGVA